MFPGFADAKNDYVFWRIFGRETHEPILVAFLNDLLALDGLYRIASVTLEPPKWRPSMPWLRYSCLRAGCVDGRGVTYSVEAQLLHIEELHRRCIDEIADSLTEPLAPVKVRPERGDEISITVSEFELWPGRGVSRVPMLSRRRMREQPRVGLVFLELPKYGASSDPLSPVDRWAYLIREAGNLLVIPPALTQTPWAEALEAARISRFTPGEWDAYISVGMAIQDKRGALSLARKEGYRAGLLEGFASYCKARWIDLSAEERHEMDRLDVEGLQAMINRIKAERGRPPREWS